MKSLGQEPEPYQHSTRTSTDPSYQGFSEGNHNSDFSDHGLVLPVFNST